ncbi:CDP-glycerol glycerophosphotransferase family protein [Staphylococcus pseudintermedius]|nr:CDP-glycerol glycerophosphotransferase family protein [Staphylococcus pseudintermedius]
MKKINFKKKVSNFRNNEGKFTYVNFRRTKPVEPNTIVLEAVHGDSLGGHIFYLIDSLLTQRPQPHLYVVIKENVEIPEFFEQRFSHAVTYVRHLSKRYYELLAVAGTLINDTTFYPFFNKRPEQKYYMVWHGTPLKYMGKDMPNMIDVANVQRNYYMADRIYVNNTYTKDILAKTAHLEGVYQGEMVVAPSPRNDAFFKPHLREEVRSFYNMEDKKILVYMPTWRGSVGRVKNSTHLREMFDYLESQLDENTVVYVKLHPFEKVQIEDNYERIKPFPSHFEPYTFLTATDGLITDYSSVMYDYANLNRPVILYTYDLEQYEEERGIYEDLREYPFTQVDTLPTLFEAIETLPKEVDYSAINERFNAVDQEKGSDIVVAHMLYDQSNEAISTERLYNGKETVAIVSGGFWNNGVTTALINTLENIDTTKRNYICFFEKHQMKPEYFERLKNLPENVHFYPIDGEINGNFKDRILLKQFMRNENLDLKQFDKQLKRIFKEEFSRIFGNLKIDWFVHYTGFERKYAGMLQFIEQKTAIWVHTDMFAEYKAKKNYSQKIIFRAYKKADKIVLVHENLRANLIRNIKGIAKKVTVVNNFLGEKRVNRLAEENLFETLQNVNVEYAYNENINVSLTERRKNVTIEEKLADISQSYPEAEQLYRHYSTLVKSQQNDEEATKREAFILSEMQQHLIQLYEDLLSEQELKQKFKYLYGTHYETIQDYYQYSPDVGVATVTFHEEFRISKVKMLDALYNPNIQVFINIGRYDYQKGHDKLITAFEKVYSENPDVFLIMICPHGPLRAQTIEWVRNSEARENIIILGGLTNPYALLKHCDAFVLSSNYEGLGLVVYEAIAVGTDAITVNLKETIAYLDNQQAIIVENDVEGLVHGMKQKIANTIELNAFDFEKYDRQSIQEFESVLNK